MHAPPLKTAAPPLLRGLAEIAGAYDVILCDVWGVIHNGVAHFPRAVDALRRFRAQGGTVVLITNAPRPRGKVIGFLDALDVPHAAYDSIVTSGDVTVDLILERGNGPLAHIGPEQDRSLFQTSADLSGKPIAFAPLEAAGFVVCTGLTDADRETPEDYAESLALMRRRDLDFICANPDIVVEMGDRLVYCAGALAELYETLGGETIYAGKPHRPIYAAALDRIAALRGAPVAPARALAIGDALRTDLAGAAAAGLDALFVADGIHRSELYGPDAPDDALQRLFAPPAPRPVAVIRALVP